MGLGRTGGKGSSIPACSGTATSPEPLLLVFGGDQQQRASWRCRSLGGARGSAPRTAVSRQHHGTITQLLPCHPHRANPTQNRANPTPSCANPTPSRANTSHQRCPAAQPLCRLEIKDKFIEGHHVVTRTNANNQAPPQGFFKGFCTKSQRVDRKGLPRAWDLQL